MKRIGRLIRLLVIVLLVVTFFKSSVLSELVDFKNQAKVSSEVSNYKEISGIVSENAIVMERESGRILMGKNYENKIHPASMTKVMTGLVGIENAGSLSRKVEISQDIIEYCQANGLSTSGFQPGDRVRVKDLLYGILLESGGEASIALATYIGGSQETFVDLMNNKAREIGMENTHFSNPTGMTDEENYTTAKDMANLFKYALNNRDFKKIIEREDYRVGKFGGFGGDHIISNNLFYKRNSLDINKAYIKCGKTGYTEAAGLCLVSLGEFEAREYIVVTAKANGNSQSPQYNLLDTEKIYKQMLEL